FQAEDGIRDGHVTGVQTCALPICLAAFRVLPTTFGTTQGRRSNLALTVTLSVVMIVQRPVPLQAPDQRRNLDPLAGFALRVTDRSEERRVGKGVCRAASRPYQRRV